MSLIQGTTRLQKLGRYFLTGGLAAIIDLGFFTFLENSGLKIWFAALLSFLIAAVANYLASASFVFKQRATFHRFFLFFMGAFCGLAVNVSVTSISAAYIGLMPIYAKILGISSAFGFNFLVNSEFVFKHHR